MAEPLDRLIERLEGLEADLVDAGDPGRYFCSTYLRTTRAVRGEIDRDGFVDGPWVERWDVVFAELYLDAVAQWRATGRAPGPWQVAFEAACDPRVVPLRHVLLGMNAHINFDLPQALVMVISPGEFDDRALVSRREADHVHIDAVLASRVRAEDRELQLVEPPGSRTVFDRLMTPFNTVGTKRFMREARAKVWANTRVLDAARRSGPAAYGSALDRLEALSRERVADLRAPGQVLLRLARGGFGVELAGPVAEVRAGGGRSTR